MKRVKQDSHPYVLSLILAAIFSIPIFLTSSLSVFMASSLSGDFALPISVFILPVIGFYLVFKFGLRIDFLYFFIILFSLFMLFFSIIAAENIYDLALFSLYFYPLLMSYQIGRLAPMTNFSINGFQYYFASISVLFATFYLISSFLEFGFFSAFTNRGSDLIFGIYSIYQKFSYYPTMLAVAYIFSLFSVRGLSRILFILILIFAVIMSGSREAMLLMFFFTFYYLLQTGFSFLFVAFIMLVAFSFLGFILIFFKDNLQNATFFLKIYDLIESGNFSAGRVEAMNYVYSNIDMNLIFYFFGTVFKVVGQEIGTPHNQYLEWHFRGGVYFLLFNLFILIVAIYRAYMSKKFIAILGVILGIVLLSNNINTPFRAPLTSMFLWFILGLVTTKLFVVRKWVGNK